MTMMTYALRRYFLFSVAAFGFTFAANNDHVNFRGECALPCDYHDKAFEALIVNGQPFSGQVQLTNVSSVDPTILSTTVIWECVWRSGPFIVFRRLNEGEYEYTCEKFTKSDSEIKYFFSTKFRFLKHVKGTPHLCDVCDGSLGLVNAIKDINSDARLLDPLPERGCTIPSICKVEKYSDRYWERCGRCEPSGLIGEGFCCSSCSKKRNSRY